MPSPFPGMDPYLEHPKLWPAFQHQLLACLYQILLPGLVDRYRARVGTRYVRLRNAAVHLDHPRRVHRGVHRDPHAHRQQARHAPGSGQPREQDHRRGPAGVPRQAPRSRPRSAGDRRDRPRPAGQADADLLARRAARVRPRRLRDARDRPGPLRDLHRDAPEAAAEVQAARSPPTTATRCSTCRPRSPAPTTSAASPARSTTRARPRPTCPSPTPTAGGSTTC